MHATFVALALQAAAPAVSPACTSADHRGFDFWVGEWVVTPRGATQPVAESRIEKLYGGCAIRETWMPYAGAGGGSLSGYDAFDKRWHQRWIDKSGTRVDFEGGLNGRSMVLTGLWRGVAGPGRDALVRMTYSAQEDGSVRQHGEQSKDQGATWATSFDFIYRPKDPQ